MEQTTNLGLNKPDTTDFYDVADFNENADIIDNFSAATQAVLDNKVDKDELIQKNNLTIKGKLTEAKWHRIAKYEASSTAEVIGKRANSCEIILKRNYDSYKSEFHHILFNSASSDYKFTSLSDHSATNKIEQIRLVIDGKNAYIDIKSSTSSDMDIQVIIQNGIDSSEAYWQPVFELLTADVAAANVKCTYIIPAKAYLLNDTMLTDTPTDDNSKVASSKCVYDALNGVSTATQAALDLKADYRFSSNLTPIEATEITENADLNNINYLKIGTYYVSQSETVANFTNCPTDTVFKMEVMSIDSTVYDNESTQPWVYRIRKIIDLWGRIYIQNVLSYGTAGEFTYSDWTKFATQADLPNITKNPDDTTGDIISTHLTVGLRATDSVIGDCSISVGVSNIANEYCSAVLGGQSNEVSGSFAAILGGESNNVSGSESSILSGADNEVSGNYSSILGGYNSIVNGFGSVVLGGHNNITSGENSVAMGCYNKPLSNQFKAGHYSKDGTNGNENGTTGDAFIIGNGTSTATSNCFRVGYDGYVYGGKTFAANSADVAELYEWQDGNPNNEDRRGLFVTLDGTKIKLASPTDTYIKGIVSAQPCLVGDAYSDNWQGMYLQDVFGAYLKDEKGNYIINPDYDATKEYIPREQRPEFDYVSNWGKLVMVDDGTCEVNGFATVGTDGKATKADTQTIYRVMERKDDTHIYVSAG